jgi:fatty acid desaturase
MTSSLRDCLDTIEYIRFTLHMLRPPVIAITGTLRCAWCGHNIETSDHAPFCEWTHIQAAIRMLDSYSDTSRR